MLASITDAFHPSNYWITTTTAAMLGPVQPFNFRLIYPFAVFPLLLIVLLIVLPGIREQRALSLLTIVVQLSVGALLIGSILLPFWKVTVAPSPAVLVHLQAYARQRHVVRMGVAVGLHSVNISLEYIRPGPNVGSDRQSSFVPVGLFLNEQFKLDKVAAMGDELRNAFADGKPFPVLKILEYFSMSQEAFAWGRHLRNAGHFTGAVLWASFAVWLLQCLLLPLLPHHFAKAGLLCGLLALTADVLFIVLSPSDLQIPFPSPDALSPMFLHFRLGACYWMSISAALLALLFSCTLCALQSLRLYSLHTFLSAQLDATVGPPKCRFGGGRRHDDDLPTVPVTPCPSGKTSLTLSHCSSSRDTSPTVSTRSGSARIGRLAHAAASSYHRTFVIPPSSSIPSDPLISNKHSVASSSIFSISGTSFGSASVPTPPPPVTTNQQMMITSRRRVIDQDDHDNLLINAASGDIKHHFATTTTTNGALILATASPVKMMLPRMEHEDVHDDDDTTKR